MLTRTPFAIGGPAAEISVANMREHSHRGKPVNPLIVRPGCQVELFDSFGALGRRVQELRGAAGLHRRPRVFTLPGVTATLEGFDLFAIDKATGAETWLGTAWAGFKCEPAMFDHIVKAEHPRQPPARLTRAAA